MTGTPLEIIRYLTEQDEKTEFECNKVPDKTLRTARANKYFWKLCNLLAIDQNTSDKEIHDKYLSENRAYYLTADKAIEWKVSEEIPNAYGLIKEEFARHDGKSDYTYYVDSNMRVKLEKEDGRKCTKKSGEEVVGIVFFHIKGTHQMDGKEMSRIINSIVYDARDRGIETEPDSEINAMLDEWAKEYEKKYSHRV